MTLNISMWSLKWCKNYQNGVLFRGYSSLALCIDFKSLFRY